MGHTTNERRLCNRFATIVDGTPTFMGGVCLIMKFRDIDVKILGRRARSPLVNPTFFSFESLDKKGRALNLGETVILQEEIQDFISVLRREGIKVTALHNHWLFEKPRLFYIHFESIDRPLSFARKVKKALKTLKGGFL